MNSRTWSKDTSFSSRSVSALFQLTGCQTWQTDGKMVRWSDEMCGVYEAGFLPLYIKSENHNHVINILNIHLESGHKKQSIGTRKGKHWAKRIARIPQLANGL